MRGSLAVAALVAGAAGGLFLAKHDLRNAVIALALAALLGFASGLRR